jgi:hypothetical protein
MAENEYGEGIDYLCVWGNRPHFVHGPHVGESYNPRYINKLHDREYYNGVPISHAACGEHAVRMKSSYQAFRRRRETPGYTPPAPPQPGARKRTAGGKVRGEQLRKVKPVEPVEAE